MEFLRPNGKDSAAIGRRVQSSENVFSAHGHKVKVPLRGGIFSARLVNWAAKESIATALGLILAVCFAGLLLRFCKAGGLGGNALPDPPRHARRDTVRSP